LGQHTKEVLEDILGLTNEDLAELENEAII